MPSSSFLPPINLELPKWSDNTTSGAPEGEGDLKAGGSGASLVNLLRAGNRGVTWKFSQHITSMWDPNLQKPICDPVDI